MVWIVFWGIVFVFVVFLFFLLLIEWGINGGDVIKLIVFFIIMMMVFI